MSFDAWFSLGITALILLVLSTTRIAADVIFCGALTLLLLFGVLSPAEALGGFANEGVATVAVLYVVVAGLRETGGINWLSQYLLGRPKSIPHAQLRLMGPVTLMSAFLNNTPVVAMLIPAVSEWAKKFKMPASKLMIPLSYAAILGGTCTLIGTSTNLVINGLLISNPDTRGLAMFELAWVGVPIVIVGIGFVMLFSGRLLPDRRSALSSFDNPREYSVEMLVEPSGPMVGKSIEDAGLRHLSSMYLSGIERDGHLMPAVAPTERLQSNDRLFFIGVVQSVLELQRLRGLVPATNQVFKLDGPRPERMLVEAVVSDTSPLVGQTVRAGRFRTNYNAVVIAVARNGERIDRKIGDITLRPGDTLLLEARRNFAEQHRNSRDFFLISKLDDSHPLRFERSAIAVLILLGLVAVVSLGVMSMLQGALLAAGLMVITGCCSSNAARRSVDWSVIIVIAASLGIGTALATSGAAQEVASALTSLAGDNLHLNLIVIYLVTTVFSAFITNSAAAVLMFPIATALAASLGVSIVPFAVTIMIAASASFATPIGYQTNLMVYGPGGYHFNDYLKIGIPLSLLIGLIAVIIIPLVWTF